MDVLVDYDNIELKARQAGLYSLCTRVIQAIVLKKGAITKCRIRLYGGWFRDHQLTRRAVDLSTEIQRDFPDALRWSGRNQTGECLTQVELACSLEIEPARTLTHTFRVRRFEDKVVFQATTLANCHHTPCSVAAIGNFFQDRKCSTVGCWMTPGDLLEKEEQKLVDTMLTADLIYLATHSQRELAVVSSDDDLWPGIQTALLSGARVIHLHTRKHWQTRNAYSGGLIEYRETNL